MNSNITISQITKIDETERYQFAALYKEVFSEKPYFENFAINDIDRDVWLPHVNQCIIIAKNTDNEVIGLGCAHSALAKTEPSIRDFLINQDLPFNLADTVFMSELAVKNKYRLQGIGTKIIIARFNWGLKNGFTTFCMRTAAEKSNSKSIYEKLGAIQAPFIQDVSNGKIATSSKKRIYLWGNISKALDRLNTLK